jgi:hypothetical protein
MRIIRNDDGYCAAVISGPRHNFVELQLVEGDDSARDVVCEELPPVGECTHAPLDAEEITRAVLEGVARGNVACGTTFAVGRIRYVKNDTRPEQIYGEMAEQIIAYASSSR